MENPSKASISSLVNSAIADGQSLVKQQIELAKAELSTSAKYAATTSGMFVSAAVLAFLAFVFALVAGAYGIVAAGLPEWAGFLIVAGALLLLGVVLALVGRSQANKITGPERTIAQVEQTKAALGGERRADGAAPGALALDRGTAVPTP